MGVVVPLSTGPSLCSCSLAALLCVKYLSDCGATAYLAPTSSRFSMTKSDTVLLSLGVLSWFISSNSTRALIVVINCLITCYSDVSGFIFSHFHFRLYCAFTRGPTNDARPRGTPGATPLIPPMVGLSGTLSALPISSSCTFLRSSIK